MSKQTQSQLVADWNAENAPGVEVDLIIGQTKISHECHTASDAYLNEFQKAAVKVKVDKIAETIEVHLRHLKPITNKGE